MSSASHNQLYVVWEVDDRDPEDTRRTVVTDPMPKAQAEQFAEREARYFAGRLEVAPARPEDLADADEQVTPRPGPFNARARILIEDAQEIAAAGSARQVAARIDGIDLADELAVYREAFGAAQARLADLLAIADEAALAMAAIGQQAAEGGRDEALLGVGHVILESRRNGESDDETLTWIMDLVDLRMRAGCDSAVEALTATAAGE